jgi:5-amino-6-(5-phosphoribosylamino)uracil reductase
MSLDGRIDDRCTQRLVLSSPEDLEDMYEARAKCDAILIGANTVRHDNPSLVIDSQELIEQRIKNKQPGELIKVTVTSTGNLDKNAKFFTKGNGQKFIICPATNFEKVSKKLSNIATILPIQEITAVNIVKTLETVGINSLFIEGGTSILTMFISQGVFHRLRLAIAPFFLGDSLAPALVTQGKFINNATNRLHITALRNLGNMIVIDMLKKDSWDG